MYAEYAKYLKYAKYVFVCIKKLGVSLANLIKSTKVSMATPQGRRLGTTHQSKSRTQNL